MNFSEKLPAFANPQGAAGKLLIASMNIFHTPVSLWGISHLDLAGNEKILDIGCGGGINLSRFLKKVPRGHVTGIDLSPDCVNYSFMRNRDAIAEGRCSVYEGSAELLPFGANHFDVITAFETIYFWPNLPNTLKEIKRVLKPGGTFIIMDVMSPGHPVRNIWLQTVEALRDTSHVQNYASGEWLSLITEAGLIARALITDRLPLEFSSWIARMRTPEVLSQAIRLYQESASAEVKAYFELQDDGSFTSDTIMAEAQKAG